MNYSVSKWTSQHLLSHLAAESIRPRLTFSRGYFGTGPLDLLNQFQVGLLDLGHLTSPWFHQHPQPNPIPGENQESLFVRERITTFLSRNHFLLNGLLFADMKRHSTEYPVRECGSAAIRGRVGLASPYELRRVS
jgi:hypothetical protein